MSCSAAASGFVTIQRPRELATAEVSVQDVLLHAVDHIEAVQDVRVDAVATLYGNVPIRVDGIIDSAIELLGRTECDSVRSFCPVGKWHPAWNVTYQAIAPLHTGRAASIGGRISNRSTCTTGRSSFPLVGPSKQGRMHRELMCSSEPIVVP